MSALSPSEVLEVLDADATVEKRASWEAFEFTLLGDGDIEVVNGSHDEPEEHTYTVHIEGGIPSDCTCPAWEYREGPCKHMMAVAIREPLLEAMSAEPTVRADGGVTVEESESDHSDERPDNCDCTPLMEDLPCWPCYRDGFEEPRTIMWMTSENG
jgi:hypothetical protein